MQQATLRSRQICACRRTESAFTKEVCQQLDDSARLFLLDPMAGGLDEMTAAQARGGAGLHFFQPARHLKGTPVALAGDEERRHLNAATGENLLLGLEAPAGAAAIPVEAAL